MDPKMLEFYLGALQFVMGDLDGSTTPSGALTPAVVAQEKLGWRIGLTAWGLHEFTLFETLEKTRELGLNYVGGLSFQKVSKDIPKNFDANLTDEELTKIRLKMDDLGLRMPTCFYAAIPGDEAGCRKVFEFGRKMGIEDVHFRASRRNRSTRSNASVTSTTSNWASTTTAPSRPRSTGSRKESSKSVKAGANEIGACPDTGYWLRSGIDPVEGIRKLGDRLITIQPHDLNEITPEGPRRPLGNR